ncbi:MAG: hypothetical protein U1F60_09735 [Planctomycetota bacterium]|nr:hypothetical protein [Planctomycetota bacterium]
MLPLPVVDASHPSGSNGACWCWSRCFAATLVGLLAYFLSCFVTPQLAEPTVFGVEWQQKSVDPWQFGGQIPHRLLAPILAHYLGLGGAHWVTFTQGTAVLMLALVHLVARWRGAAVIDATLITLAVAATGTVQIYKVSLVGYVDNLGYAILLLMWLVARRPVLFWTLFLACLTNHEMVLFFLPWLWYVRRLAGGSAKADVLAIGVVFGLYKLFRMYVGAHSPTWAYDGDYFLAHTFLPITFLWLWALSGVYLVTMFGPLLAVVGWHVAAPRPRGERWHAALLIGGMLAIFLFAYDFFRHSNMMAFPLLIASVRFLGSTRSRLVYAASIVATAILGSYACYGETHRWLFLTMQIECGGHQLIEPANRFHLALHWDILVGTVQRAWPQLLQIAALAVGIGGLVLVYRRYRIGGEDERPAAAP